MKSLQSEGFKSRMLLDYGPGEEVSILCRSWRETDCKAACCRAFEKRRYEDLLERGVESLTIRKVGNNVVLVRFEPIGTDAEWLKGQSIIASIERP